MEATTVDPRYPIGKFRMEKEVTAAKREQAIGEIAAAPQNFREALLNLGDRELDTPYREGGWTVRQLIHHVADSHMNAYVRWKLALTETEPTIKPYEEKAWAELYDASTMPIDVSLDLIESLHRRWVSLLESLSEEQWER